MLFWLDFLGKNPQKIGVKKPSYQYEQINLDLLLWLGWSFLLTK
jgi:hypothetical protein